MRFRSRHLPLAAVLLLASACSQPASPDGAGQDGTEGEASKPSDSQVRDILQAHLDRNPACTPFFAMPRDLPADAIHEQKRMEALAAAGLVRREEGSAIRYTVTSNGAKFIRPGTGALASAKSVICYGRYEVGEVEVGSVDAVIGTANVTYRYELKDAAPWLDAPAITAAYPDFSKWRAERQGEDQHETLHWRDGKWTVDQPSGPDMYDLRRLAH